jgi:hypothetical protein
MKKLALLSAVGLLPLTMSSAQANILDIHLFSPSSDRTIVQPAVIQQPAVIPAMTAPVMQNNIITEPAVVAPSTSVTESSVSVSTPPLTDMQIRAMPSVVDSGQMTVESTTTLPAVVDPVSDVVAPATTVQQTSSSAVISPISVGSPILGLNAADRLSDMMDQIQVGVSNGTITSDVQASLTAEHDSISTLINSLAPGGLTTDEVNQIETQLNLFNQHISSAMGG